MKNYYDMICHNNEFEIFCQPQNVMLLQRKRNQSA